MTLSDLTRCALCDTPDTCGRAGRCLLDDILEPAPLLPPRARILRAAEGLICGDRQTDYGPPAENFARVAALWGAYLGRPVTAAQVCDCLALLKLARLAHQPGHEDSRIDAAGYLALGAEVQG